MESAFIFTVCQIGAEKALKKEILRNYPDFRFAFSRPGFVTFKSSKGSVPLEFELRSVFAREYGISFGIIDQTKTPDGSVATRALELAQALKKDSKPHLHIWERDFFFPGDEPLSFTPGALLGDMEAQIRRSGLFEESPFAKTGDPVLQMIALDPGVWALGACTYSKAHSPWPGGRPNILLPESAPSRAYLKLEESLQWSGLPFQKNDMVVELGSSPGGATLAMLNRDMRVIGIDPRDMDPSILRNPSFKHIQKPVAQVMREDLPVSVQWLVLDINVAPSISLFAVDRLVSRMKDSLLGVLLTVKINDWKFADEIPHMVEHVKAMGMSRVRTGQLSFHRQEFLICGLTRKGITRR